MIFSPKLKSFLKRIAVVSIALTVIGFILNVVADNPYSHRLIRELINNKVRSETNIDLDFQAIKVGIVPFGVDLYGLDVRPHGIQDSSILKASRIKARVSLWSILIGEPKLGILEFYDPVFTVPIPGGIDHLLKQDPNAIKSELPLTWPPEINSIPVNTLSLKNARVYVEIPDGEDPQNPLVVSSIKGFDLNANISNLSEMELYFYIKNIDLNLAGKPVLRDTEFETDIIISSEKIHKSPFRILSKHLDFGGIVAGNFDRRQKNILEAINLEIDFEGNGDIAQLGQVFNIPETSGSVKGDGHVRIYIPTKPNTKPKLHITANAESDGAKIREFNLYQTKAKLEIDLEKLTVSEANVRVGQEEVGIAKGTIGFDPSVPFDFQATPDGLLLTDLLKALTVDFDVIESEIKSKNLTVRGTGDPLKLIVSANADFSNLHVPALQIEGAKQSNLPTCRMQVNLEVNDDRINFDNSKGTCFLKQSSDTRTTAPDSSDSSPSGMPYASPLDFSGYATFKKHSGMNLKIKSDQLSLPLLNDLTNVPASGVGTVEAVVKGPYSDLVVESNFEVSDLNISDIPIGRSTGFVKVTDKGQTIAWQDVRAAFSNDGSFLSEQGKFHPKSQNINLKLRVVDAPQNIAEKIFSLAGLAESSMNIHSLNADLNGPLMQPLAYRGNLEFFFRNLVSKDRAKIDVLSGKFKLSDESIDVESLNLEVQDFQLRTEASISRLSPIPPTPDRNNLLRTLGLHPESKIKLKSETYLSSRWKEARSSPTFFVDHLQALPVISEYAKLAKIKGRLEVEANFEGTLQLVEGSFKTRTSKTQILNSSVAPISLEGLIANKKLDLVVSHSGDALYGRMNIDLSQPTFPYSWYLNAKRLDLRALGSQFFSDDPRNFAYFTGEWSMSGDLNNWWHSEGELSVNEVRMRYFRDVRGESKVFELKDRRPVKVNFRRGGWTFENNDELLLESERFRLHVGLGRSRPPDYFDISFDGYFDLVMLQNMSQSIETASGLVEFDGRVTGNVNDPDFSFNIRNKKDESGNSVTVGFAPIRPPFTDVNFDATYTDDRLIVNSLTAKKGGGTITMSGQTVFSDASFEESRIDITLDHATVLYQVSLLKSFEMELSGAVAVSGNKPPFNISGDIVVDRARSAREFDLLEQIIGALQRREFDKPLVPEAPIANLDLRVSADNSIEIYNRTIQSVLSSNLTIKGNNVAPVVNGQIEVNKGTFAYKYQRDFRITQGLITFDDPLKPDPRLDILGMSEIAGYRVYLTIIGRASSPKVDLSIDPPTREDGTLLTKLDVLILMSTGSLPERTQTNSATSAAQAEALNLLVGQFEEPVEKLFDLSGQTVVQRVYIDTYAGEDGPTPRLNLPLNLHRDWDVIFRVDENNQKVSLGYTINDSISVSGSVDSQRESQNTRVNRSEATQNGPDTGVDLKFRFSFP